MAGAQPKHARKRATPAAAAKNRAAAQAARKPRKKAAGRPVRYAGGKPMGAPATSAGRREVTPRQVAGAPGNAAVTITQREGRYGAKHMLTAELIVAVVIVAIRAVADYEPQADGTLKGKVGHPKGQYGPLPILAGLIVSFFLLSFLAAAGGTRAKIAVIAGFALDLALLMNSGPEFDKVADTFSTFGKAKKPPGAWLSTGAESGLPISGTVPATGPGSLNPKGSGPAVTPPAGSIPVPKGGCPGGYLEEGDPKTGAKWCAPTMG